MHTRSASHSHFTALLDSPLLNASGFSEMSQCPASTSTIWNLGKNLPMRGIASSGTYLLFVPRTNNAGFSNRNSSGSLKGKSPSLSKAEPSVWSGMWNCSGSSEDRLERLPRRNCRIVRDCEQVSRASYKPSRSSLPPRSPVESCLLLLAF